DVVHGRHVYRSRGALDGKGGLRLQYEKSETAGAWEITSSAGRCLYRLKGNAASPADFIGRRSWDRSYGGECVLVVMQKAEADVEPGGWIEGGLLALDTELSL
ncbi:unnamed protein product, partial [Symbiodinium sp. KB8]